MTTLTIPAGSNSTTINLPVGSYSAVATSNKYITISKNFQVVQADIENGTKSVEIGTMQAGKHTFRVSVTGLPSGQEATATLLKGSTVLETAETVNGVASFTVTAVDHTGTADNYVIKITKDGYKTVQQNTEATLSEYASNGSESVTIAIGNDYTVVTLTVIADAAVNVVVD